MNYVIDIGMNVIDRRTNPKELSTIAKAHAYVNEYLSNGYDRVSAYQTALKSTYESAKANYTRYHQSEPVRQAFRELLGDSVRDQFKSKYGIVFEAQALYDLAKVESVDQALKCLKFIAEIMDHMPKAKGVDARQVHNTFNVDAKSLKSILSDLRSMQDVLADDNGRQDGAVKPSVVKDLGSVDDDDDDAA